MIGRDVHTARRTGANQSRVGFATMTTAASTGVGVCSTAEAVGTRLSVGLGSDIGAVTDSFVAAASTIGTTGNAGSNGVSPA